MIDKTRKKRQHRGENHPRTKLTADKVRQIRKLRSQGFMHKEIAEMVESTESAVGHVLYGNSWTHVT
jgi:SOS response regulatory protein OraA/RecX